MNSFELLARDHKARKMADFLYPRLKLTDMAISEVEDADAGWWRLVAIQAGVNPPGRDAETKRAVIQMLYDRQAAERKANGEDDR